ncbi:radical SAM protein [Fundidesulfovibrio butyratiphilus]
MVPFSHPQPPVSYLPVFPVFLPQAGCPGRCLFCAQEKQSGKARPDLQREVDALGQALALRTSSRRHELAFYGGTFTALPDDFAFRFLEVAAPFRARGAVSGIRCSTRPDAVSPGLLARLADAGLTRIELGVQSFQDEPLALARRGHDGDASRRACEQVLEAGLDLGVHLLPGLPGHTPDDLEADAAEAARLGASFVRLHPCLVLEGTGLEAVWRRGAFEPWSLELCLEVLPATVLALWRAGVNVARIGLAPEPGLLAARLAGPWHPALGMRVRARALLAHVAELLDGRRAARLEVPSRFSGEFFGHAGELAPAYRALGLERKDIVFIKGERFTMTIHPCAA